MVGGGYKKNIWRGFFPSSAIPLALLSCSNGGKFIEEALEGFYASKNGRKGWA